MTIDAKTLYRCGLVWLVCAVFLFDGSSFVRAQEAAPGNDEQVGMEKMAAEVEESNQGGEYAVPIWFETQTEFSDENRMLFVRTRPEEAMADPLNAKEKLLEVSIAAVRDVIAKWLLIENAQQIDLQPEFVLEKLVFENRIVIRRDLECETAMQSKPLLGNKFYGGYAQLHLTDEFKTYVQDQNRELTTQKRLIKSGLVGGSVLAILAVVFGYLKMETATRGFYSRRLQTGSLVVVTVVLLLFYWFGQRL